MKNRAYSPSTITVALKMKASDLFSQNIAMSQKHPLQQLLQARGHIQEAARKPQTREHTTSAVVILAFYDQAPSELKTPPEILAVIVYARSALSYVAMEAGNEWGCAPDFLPNESAQWLGDASSHPQRLAHEWSAVEDRTREHPLSSITRLPGCSLLANGAWHKTVSYKLTLQSSCSPV